MENSDDGLKDNDHRVLGQKLDLFSFHDIAPGAPFWHPKGMVIFRALEDYAREINMRAGYDEINTPIMVKKELFERSGRWEFYRDNMFWFKNPRDENEVLSLKPMNCPESTYVYNAAVRSYRDLPIRLAEFGRLHRNELSGTLGGLFRVRQITMDDAHIFVIPETAEAELVRVMKIIDDFYKLFGFKATYLIATRPEKALGEKEQWDLAEKALAGALKKCDIPFKIAQGEGAFYGPKIEVHILDSQGRDWQMGTAQLDLTMLPDKFALTYTDQSGKKKTPWVIHRAIFGSFERFIGMLLEHTNGALPVWLSPIQAAIIPVSEHQAAYAAKIDEQLKTVKARTSLISDGETLSKRIRQAKVQKIPYIIVVGEKEVNAESITVESRDKSLGQMKLSDFNSFLLNEITTRA